MSSILITGRPNPAPRSAPGKSYKELAIWSVICAIWMATVGIRRGFDDGGPDRPLRTPRHNSNYRRYTFGINREGCPVAVYTISSPKIFADEFWRLAFINAKLTHAVAQHYRISFNHWATLAYRVAAALALVRAFHQAAA
jgi:hypothetical protein